MNMILGPEGHIKIINDPNPRRRMTFRQYKRSSIAEMTPWHPGFDMKDVSISTADLNGSPTEGDMIARNPENHDDKWLVAATYFAANFEPFN